MRKLPIQGAGRTPRTIEGEAVEVVDPSKRKHPTARVDPAPRNHGFFSFSYSYTEISAFGDRAHVKSKTARFADGKLTSERFEGDIPRSAYDGIVRDAQRQFLEQTTLFTKTLASALSFLLPPSRK
jgi:hypothetical protein